MHITSIVLEFIFIYMALNYFYIYRSLKNNIANYNKSDAIVSSVKKIVSLNVIKYKFYDTDNKEINGVSFSSSNISLKEGDTMLALYDEKFPRFNCLENYATDTMNAFRNRAYFFLVAIVVIAVGIGVDKYNEFF